MKKNESESEFKRRNLKFFKFPPDEFLKFFFFVVVVFLCHELCEDFKRHKPRPHHVWANSNIFFTNLFLIVG